MKWLILIPFYLAVLIISFDVGTWFFNWFFPWFFSFEWLRVFGVGGPLEHPENFNPMLFVFAAALGGGLVWMIIRLSFYYLILHIGEKFAIWEARKVEKMWQDSAPPKPPAQPRRRRIK